MISASLRYCDNGVAFLVNNADKKYKFSRDRVVVDRWAGTNASRDHQYLVERQPISTIQSLSVPNKSQVGGACGRLRYFELVAYVVHPCLHTRIRGYDIRYMSKITNRRNFLDTSPDSLPISMLCESLVGARVRIGDSVQWRVQSKSTLT